MPCELSFGDGRDVGGATFVAVAGKINITTIDEFRKKVAPYIRQPGSLVLDFSSVTCLDGKGLLEIIRLKYDYPRCGLKLVNVDGKFTAKFSQLAVGKTGIEVEFRSEVA